MKKSLRLQVLGSNPTAYTKAWVGSPGGGDDSRLLPVENYEVKINGGLTVGSVFDPVVLWSFLIFA